MNEAELRARIVEVARAEIGPGRVLEEYWRDVLGPEHKGPHPEHWCGAFALWCLHQSGVALGVLWRPSLGFLPWSMKRKDPRTALPGDVMYKPEPYQHHAIVVTPDLGELVTVDGNPTVRESRHAFGAPGSPGEIDVFDVSRWLSEVCRDTDPHELQPEGGDDEK